MTVGEELEIRYYNGIIRGREEGINKKSVEAVDAFVSRYNIPLEEACETIGLSVEEYRKLKANKEWNKE